VYLRLASRKSVKRETNKYVAFILVGSYGLYLEIEMMENNL